MPFIDPNRTYGWLIDFGTDAMHEHLASIFRFSLCVAKTFGLVVLVRGGGGGGGRREWWKLAGMCLYQIENVFSLGSSSHILSDYLFLNRKEDGFNKRGLLVISFGLNKERHPHKPLGISRLSLILFLFLIKLNSYLLSAECEVRKASYGPSFFLPFMAQARKARAMKTRKEKTRIRNLPYGPSKRG